MKHKAYIIFLLIATTAFAQVAMTPYIFDLRGRQTARTVPKLLNYQGYLTDTLGIPLDDTLDMTFKIFDAATVGNQLWSETQNNVPVERGIFSVLLGGATPIPDTVFTQGTDRWLELTVDVQTLSPRTRITTVGYAYTSTYSDTAEYARNGAADNDWSVTDSVLYTEKQWGIARGDAGNVAYGDSLHTHINFGVECTTGTPVSGDAYDIYCTVGGGYGNRAGLMGATVCGGVNNIAGDFWSFVGGGVENEASNRRSTVCGGYRNRATGYDDVVCAGNNNTASGYESFVGSGNNNTASGQKSVVCGGAINTASAYLSAVCGGSFNTASGEWSIVCGGDDNNAGGDYSFIGGGLENHIDSTCSLSVICGGDSNVVSGVYSTIVGGYENNVSGGYATIGGGMFNVADHNLTTIGGGYSNYAGGHWSTVSGGYLNKDSCEFGAIGGGIGNVAKGDYSTISGGAWNKTQAGYATISGGKYNMTEAMFATISGGGTTDTFDILTANLVTDNYGTIGGGGNNQAGDSAGTTEDAIFATVGGGVDNKASGNYASIPGGRQNIAEGDYSFAAGRRAEANHAGTFVWADSTDAPFASSGNNQFLIRATGGVGINTTEPTHQLTIASGTNSTLRLIGPNGSYGHGAQLNFGDGSYVVIEEDGDDSLHILATGRIALTGANVGIGTTNPYRKLDVAGAANLNKGLTGTALYVNNSEALWFNGTYFSWGYGGTYNYFADKISIRTTAPTATLDVNGLYGYDQLRMRKSYTPSGTSDTNGNVGDIAWDNNYVYIKTSGGWKRAALTTF